MNRRTEQNEKSFKSFLYPFLGIIIGLAISSTYFVAMVWFFSYATSYEAGVWVWFFTILGLIIFLISGLVSGLFVRQKGDVVMIIAPNAIVTFGGGLALMIYYSIIWGWYSTWYIVWSWIVIILWFLYTFLLPASIIAGGAITGGFKVKPFKREIEYGSSTTTHSFLKQQRFFFCSKCGTKQLVQNKFCTFCGFQILVDSHNE